MKTMTKMMLAATVAMSALSAATAADAAIVINVTQVGANISVVGSGSINTTGLTSAGTGGYSTVLGGTVGSALVGINGAQSRQYTSAFTNPGTFATGSQATASSGTGSNFGLYSGPTVNSIFLPVNYVSGTALTGTSLYLNRTFALLGLTEGSYVYNLTNGDRVTVNIGEQAGAVPETATWGMMIAGFGMMGAALRTRRRSAKVSFA